MSFFTANESEIELPDLFVNIKQEMYFELA